MISSIKNLSKIESIFELYPFPSLAQQIITTKTAALKFHEYYYGMASEKIGIIKAIGDLKKFFVCKPIFLCETEFKDLVYITSYKRLYEEQTNILIIFLNDKNRK
jgi:hypothetical protein